MQSEIVRALVGLAGIVFWSVFIWLMVK